MNQRSGLTTAADTLRELAAFLGRHRHTILALVQFLSPTDAPAVDAAISSIITASDLFIRIYDTYLEHLHP